MRINKGTILIVFLLLALFSHGASAQTVDELRKFAEVQRALAGDPNQWASRRTDANNFFYPILTDPKQISDAEKAQRTQPVLNSNPLAQNDKDYIRYFEALYDEESDEGAFYREQAGTPDLLSGNIKLRTDAETELGKIKSMYEQITTRVAQYAEPSGDKPSSCLIENMGECRHMATILQESMEEYGINSELVVAPGHAWVRVTLSDPRYAGITFDLDPTWYAQPIPLAPRDGTPMSPSWEKLMTAILPSPTPTITPTPSITLTPTITETPTLTPTISITLEPTAPAAYPTSTSGGSSSECSGGGVCSR
ncbi:MAG: hypothetical protein Q8Q49_01545 [bacterium]|nr:hypothetical protein [bacterium]